jgi:hypothetical protein
VARKKPYPDPIAKAWRIHFFQRHELNDPATPVPGLDFLQACPEAVRAKFDEAARRRRGSLDRDDWRGCREAGKSASRQPRAVASLTTVDRVGFGCSVVNNRRTISGCAEI